MDEVSVFKEQILSTLTMHVNGLITDRELATNIYTAAVALLDYTERHPVGKGEVDPNTGLRM